jgi:two-component system nitrate/nitrite response regulator NarL
MSTVVLLHADREVATRLAGTIAAEPGLEVGGVAHNLPGLRDVFAPGLPDLLVVDLMLPPSHLRSLLISLRGSGQFGRPVVLALTVAADDARLMEALRHGADGYFVQVHADGSLARTITQLLQGESTMSPQIARQVKAHFDARGWHDTAFGGDPANPLRLNQADELLLQWTAEGYLVNEVARGLQMSVQAVGVRMRNIYRKLQFDLRSTAPAIAA